MSASFKYVAPSFSTLKGSNKNSSKCNHSLNMVEISRCITQVSYGQAKAKNISGQTLDFFKNVTKGIKINFVDHI